MNQPNFVLLIAAIVTLAGGPPATADVIRAAPGGVVVRTTVEVAAAPDAVYDALTTRVGEWWGATNTWSGNPRNLSIDARAGGCFCETLSNGGSVQHMQVVWAERGSLLRLSGAPGKLQEGAFIGTLSWLLTRTATGTRIEMTFALSGFAAGGLDQIAKVVDESWAGQVKSLERYIATLKP